MVRVFLAGMLALAVGCEEGSWLPKSSYVSESIVGRSWDGGVDARLSFSGHNLRASVCFAMSAPYRLSDGALVIDGPALFEQSGCLDALDDDDWFKREFLQSSPEYELHWPRLTLTDGVVTIVFVDVEVADPDQPLIGTAWEVEGMIESGNVGFFADDEAATLHFRDDGVLAIETPCASGTAAFTDFGGSVVLEAVDIGATDCPGDDVSYRYELHMRELLIDGTFTYSIDAGVMTFERGDLGLYLTAP